MRKLIVLAAVLAVAGCTSAKSAASGGDPTTGPAATATSATTPATTTPPAPTGKGGDWCALAAKIGHDSGMLVGNHYINPLNETLDQLKALVNESLANQDALLTGVPPDVHAALLVEGDYFKALHDHDFSSSTPVPAGLTDALAVVNKYQTDVCGFVFDK